MTLRRASAFWGKKNNGSSLPYTPPLDIFNNSIAAYSVRKLRSAYTGPCVRIANTNTGSELDIFFDDSGLVDTATILAHIGSFNAAIVKWYDQSINGNDATGQSANANRKLIAFEGAIPLINGKPSLGNKTNAVTAQSNSLQLVSDITVGSLFAVGKNREIAAQAVSYIAYKGSPTNDGFFTSGSLAGVSGFGVVKSGSVSDLVGSSENTNQNLWEYIGGSTDYIYVNGTLEDTATITNPTINELGRSIAFGGGVNLSIDGSIQEMIFFSDDKSSERTSIESNINSYFSIY